MQNIELTATLVKPARLNYLGRVWERDVAVPIDLELARTLNDNPRFKVSGLLEALQAALDSKPAPKPVEPNPAPATTETQGAAETSTEGSEQTGDTEQTGDPVKPTEAAALHASILDAADDLDPDDEGAFDDKGKPSHKALSKALGYEVTAEEVDAALAAAQKAAADRAPKPPADPKPKGGVRVVKGKKGAAPALTADPTTAGAVEV